MTSPANNIGPQTAVRIVPLEIGRLDTDLRIITGEERRAIFPIPSWLIEHPKGLVLFDTGLHRDLQTSSERIGKSSRFFTPDFPGGEELSARLSARGIRPDDITHIIFSHLHFDHAGGTAEIPDARIVIQADEWAAGNETANIESGVYDPRDYQLGHDLETIEGVHDVFGDGALVCIPTPGHTPGHQALRVELASGPVVLTGDCIYFEDMLDQMAVPRFGYDTEQQLTSMTRLKRMRDRDGCRLLFGHDHAQFKGLPSVGLV